MIDTLTTIVEAIQQNQNIGFDLIQKVDTFYNNAWTKLIYVITIGMTVVGIIIPLYVHWRQKKALKASEDVLKKEISDKTAAIKGTISSELMSLIDEKFKEYEKEIKMTRASGKADTFFAQAKYNFEKNDHRRALSDLINASYACIECGNHKTLQDVVKYILTNCLPYLSIEEIKDLEVAKEADLNLFLGYLTDKDDRGTFSETIGEIRVKITKLPKLIKDKPEEQSKQPQK